VQLVLDEVLSNLEWQHSLGAMQDKFFLHLVLFVAEGIGSDKTLQISSPDFNVSNTMQRCLLGKKKQI